LTCSSNTYSGLETNNLPWVNWSGRVAGPVGTFSTPDSLPDLVNVLERAAAGSHQVRVVGSGWAFENIAYSADWMVSLARLNKPLTAVTDSALNAEWAAHQAATSDDVLFEIEAGASVADVNDALAAVGLGMPTLGGANGQALAGAISTSTHGGDISTPPLADFVMAMHVVTVGGREVWLERASQPITDDMALAAVLTCPDTEILRDDPLFDALLVGFGRFGIIYSYVLRVKRAYRLAEWTIQLPRIVVTTQLRIGVATGTFLAPLLTILPDPPPALMAMDVKNPRGLEIVFDTQHVDMCWVKRRWLTDDSSDLNIANSANELCKLGASGVLGIAVSALQALTILPPWVFAPFWVMGEQTALSASLVQNQQMTAGEMLARALSAIWRLQAQASIGPLAALQFTEAYKFTTAAGVRGPSSIVLSGFREQSLQNCFRADSIEPIFDAHSKGYLDFLDTVVALSPQTKQAGYISLRWSAMSQATLSMHNIPSANAVAIEVTSLRGLPDNQSWMATLEFLAINFGGRPHWGQINTLHASAVATLYGKQLQDWTAALTAFTGGSIMFSTPHTLQRGLEPTNPAAMPTLFGMRAGDLLGALGAAISLLLSDPVKIRKPHPRPIRPPA
jgi:hypothetical protein